MERRATPLALVKRAADVVKSTCARICDADVDDAIRFVRTLGEAALAGEVRTDLGGAQCESILR